MKEKVIELLMFFGSAAAFAGLMWWGIVTETGGW